MLVLGLDLGEHTGFAITGQHDPVRVCWMKHYPSGTLNRPLRFATFSDDLRATILDWHPGVIAYELPLSRGQAAKRTLFGYAAIVEAVAHAAGLPSLDINVGSVKRHAGALPTAGKEPVIAAARLLGFAPEGEHDADAAVLADLVARRMVVEAAVKKAGRKRRAA